MIRSAMMSILIGLAIIISLSVFSLPKPSLITDEAHQRTPTLAFDPVIRSNFLSLLTIDEECLFPCWQGLTLGESSLENAIEVSTTILLSKSSGRAPFGIFQEYERDFNFSYLPGVVADGVAINLSILTMADQFSAVSISYLGYDSSTSTETLPNDYHIENVIDAYGLPDEIWLLGSPYTVITLLYSTRGLSIEYERIEIQISNKANTRTICPEDFAGFGLVAYIPGDIDLSDYLWTNQNRFA